LLRTAEGISCGYGGERYQNMPEPLTNILYQEIFSYNESVSVGYQSYERQNKI